MRSHRAVSAVTVLLTAFLLGCGGGRGIAQDPMAPGGGYEAPVRLTVQNNDFNDAVIYANWTGGLRNRVALFTGKTSQTVSFPWRGDVVQFYVDFIAGNGFMVDAMTVSPGDHLDLVLMAESSTRGGGAFVDPSTGQIPVVTPDP